MIEKLLVLNWQQIGLKHMRKVVSKQNSLAGAQKKKKYKLYDTFDKFLFFLSFFRNPIMM